MISRYVVFAWFGYHCTGQALQDGFEHLCTTQKASLVAFTGDLRIQNCPPEGGKQADTFPKQHYGRNISPQRDQLKFGLCSC